MKTKGNWVIKTSTGLYWCGNSAFDAQLRKAQVYHWKEAAESQIEVIKHKRYMPADLECEVIAISEPKELKDTEAEWCIIANDNLTGLPEYVCSNCGHPALHYQQGRSVASRFCPHCGKFVINSTMSNID